MPFFVPFEICTEDLGAAEVEVIRGSWLGVRLAKAVSQQLVQERFSGRSAQGCFGAVPGDGVIVAGRAQLKRVTIDGNQVLTDDPERLRM